jgi:hypothetical protein
MIEISGKDGNEGKVKGKSKKTLLFLLPLIVLGVRENCNYYQNYN